MTLALIGAAGVAGRHLVPAALAAGHTVRVLTRRPEAYQQWAERITIIKGDATNLDDITTLVQGCHAVLNAAGRLKNAGDFYSRITANILAALPASPKVRYITVSSLALILPGEKPNLVQKLARFLFRIPFAQLVADKEAEARLLSASAIRWTILRCPLINGSNRGQTYRPNGLIPGLFVGSQFLAKLMVSLAEN